MTTTDPPNDVRPPGRVALAQNVVYRTFVTETVLLNVSTGRYHGLNRTAGRMLELLDKLGDTQQVTALLSEEYAQPTEVIERDLATFCADLLARALITVADADA